MAKKITTPDIVISGEQIQKLVNKVINGGFKKNNKLKPKEIDYYYQQVYRSIKDRIKEVIKEEHGDDEIKTMILEDLLEKYSWEELVEIGIKE